jgi:hypothetical protein
MKRKILLLIAGLIIVFSSSTAQSVNKRLNEFAIDLAASNIKLRGSLLLIGEYTDNLSALTFERYCVLLKQHETPSTKGVSKVIREANNHFFHSDTSTFKIVLYIKKFDAIIFDDANTFGIDSIKILMRNEKVPELIEFAGKSRL